MKPDGSRQGTTIGLRFHGVGDLAYQVAGRSFVPYTATPPGFELLREDLESHLRKTAVRKSGRLEKFTISATRAVLYLDSLAPGARVTIPYRLQAKYPIRAAGFPSRVYQYYDPAVSSTVRPVAMEVRER